MWMVHPVQNAECFDLVGPILVVFGVLSVITDAWVSPDGLRASHPQSAATCLSFILFRSRSLVPSMQGLFQSSAVQRAEYPIKSKTKPELFGCTTLRLRG